MDSCEDKNITLEKISFHCTVDIGQKKGGGEGNHINLKWGEILFEGTFLISSIGIFTRYLSNIHSMTARRLKKGPDHLGPGFGDLGSSLDSSC